MGLDMYLTASRYISGANYPDNESNVAAHAALCKLAGITPPPVEFGSARIEITVAYWRKANAIHAWFVRNVQDGQDDCNDYDVTREQLVELRELCRQVLRSSSVTPGLIETGKRIGPETGGKWERMFAPGEIVADPTAAMELLPTAGGFFFGSTNYDAYYLADLVSTVDLLTHALTTCSEAVWSFQYHSSW